MSWRIGFRHELAGFVSVSGREITELAVLIREDKEKVSLSPAEMQIHGHANYRPHPIFDDKVVMDKYNLGYTVVTH